MALKRMSSPTYRRGAALAALAKSETIQPSRVATADATREGARAEAAEGREAHCILDADRRRTEQRAACAMFLLAYDANEGTHGRGRTRNCRRRRRSANEEGRTRVQSANRRRLCRGGADLQRGRGRARAQGEGRKEELEGGKV